MSVDLLAETIIGAIPSTVPSLVFIATFSHLAAAI
jgi:hypothetical protein